MNDPRPLYERAADQFASLLKTVTPERLGDPTPCTEFDVRALLSHVVGGTHRIATIGEGGDGLSVPARVDGVADDGWTTVYEEARRRFTAAWADDAKLSRLVAVPWAAELPGAAAVGGYVMETLTHTWDLSQALGHPMALDEELAKVILPIAQQVLPADSRGEGVPFAAVQEAPEGADAYGRLASWLGRAA
ncbi:TIGR03086 family metal-binding protein [Streptomyces sp. NPDC002730]|uniref:TIGR03086 family metal-binding protein n=1 Tax=Streptomyces sp. NPDC002730 TaxID=3364662 RepID=UPI00367A6080